MTKFEKISVIIPAHNEEEFIEGCLIAILSAAELVSVEVEIIVVLNRCTDKTQEIAEQYEAICIADESRCIAAVRNKGCFAATGDIIVTCDADSRLHKNSLMLVLKALSKNNIIGGGMRITFDRYSPGIRATQLLLDMAEKVTRLPCGAFWTTKSAFLAVSGFDESLTIAEDVYFAKKLKAYGKSISKKYILLKGSPLVTSTRKFDHFGDWMLLKMVFFDFFKIRRSLKGIDTAFADEYFHDFNDRK